MESAQSLSIEIRPSRLLAGLIGILHVLAMLAAWIAIDAWPSVLVLAGVALSGAACVAFALGAPRSTVSALELHADGRAFWRDRSGAWHGGRLARPRAVVPPLVVLGVVGPLGVRRLVLLPDSISGDGLRRLRVWLRWPRERDSANNPAAR